MIINVHCTQFFVASIKLTRQNMDERKVVDYNGKQFLELSKTFAIGFYRATLC